MSKLRHNQAALQELLTHEWIFTKHSMYLLTKQSLIANIHEVQQTSGTDEQESMMHLNINLLRFIAQIQV